MQNRGNEYWKNDNIMFFRKSLNFFIKIRLNELWVFEFFFNIFAASSILKSREVGKEQFFEFGCSYIFLVSLSM